MRDISERFRRRAREIVGANEPPTRLAAAWAVGVAIGLSPVIGLHTALALILAFAFRLNKIDVLLGTLVVNPWTFPPYFAFSVMVGQWMTGLRVPRIVVPGLSTLLSPDAWREQATWLTPLLTVWAAGAGLFALVGGTATFVVVRSFIVRRRSRRHRDPAEPRPL